MARRVLFLAQNARGSTMANASTRPSKASTAAKPDPKIETWELWYPEAAASGLPFARGRMNPTTVLWVHSAPESLAVTVRDSGDRPVANGEGLQRQGKQLPMTRLARDG